MIKTDIERNAEIVAMRKDGATFQEIAEWYGICNSRVQEICRRFKDYGDTKEEIIQNWNRKQEKRRNQYEQFRAWEEKRSGGRQYCIRNGAGDVFMTEIKEGGGGETMYRYDSTEIRDALFFTLKEARRIAKKRRAVVCWVPDGRGLFKND